MKTHYIYISAKYWSQVGKLNICTHVWDKRGDALFYFWSMRTIRYSNTDLIDNITTI